MTIMIVDNVGLGAGSRKSATKALIHSSYQALNCTNYNHNTIEQGCHMRYIFVAHSLPHHTQLSSA